MIFAQLNPGPCRTYLIGSAETREALLVDPVLERIEEYLARLAHDRLTLRYVIDTHTHADHVSGAVALSERTGAEYAMHKSAPARRLARRLGDGERLRLADLAIDVIETPGHTRDSISLLLPERILTGDWLFIGSAGRTDLPGGDPGEHWDSIQRVVPRLAESTRIHPAHDYQNQTESTLARERETNANLTPRSRDEYVRWLSSFAQPTPDWMVKTIEANNLGTTDPRVNYMPPDGAACMCQPMFQKPESVPTVTVDDVHEMLNGPEAPIILDVRQPEEYVGPLGHIPGAVLVPLGELSQRLSELEPHRARTVVAVCRTGGRSASATTMLLQAGFTNVFNLAGGTLAWNEKGYPVEREPPEGSPRR